MQNPQLIVHAALACEVQWLIDAFDLQLEESVFGRCYSSLDNRLVVLISGVGQLNTIMTCSYYIGRVDDCSRTVWLNIGIAGHQSLPIGSLCWVTSIKDEQKQTVVYPHSVVAIDKYADSCQSLTSYERPQNNYQQMNGLVDMEASVFFAVANRVTSVENIQSIKIVSDNGEQSCEHSSKAKVIALMNGKQQQLLHNVNALLMWSCQEHYSFIVKLNSYYQTISRDYYATASQKHQLRDLLRKALACDMTLESIQSHFSGGRSKIMFTQGLRSLESALALTIFGR